MVVLPEVSETTSPEEGAGAESVRVKLCAPVPASVTVEGEKASVAATWTVVLAGVYPTADAVTAAFPKFTPFT
jgi:hypothetical protein